jgi:hypothetical protein
MDRIKEIWSMLGENPPSLEGLIKVRYSKDSTCNLFLGFKTPLLQHTLSIRLHKKYGDLINIEKKFKGIVIEKLIDPESESHFLLNVVLLDKQLDDIYDVFISDLIVNLIDLNNDLKIISVLFGRLEKWKNLLVLIKPDCLTLEQQQGLFGELYLLKKMLLNSKNQFSLVINWVGPNGANKDFQFKDIAIEVKTSHSNHYNKITINNENQLDTCNLKMLILFHLSLEIRDNAGITLNQIVDEIKEIIVNDYNIYPIFITKLITIGYNDIHRPNYEQRGYFIKDEIFYNIKDNFPRIEEKDIRKGVGEVKYSIIVDDFYSYKIDNESVFNNILKEHYAN